MREAQQDLQMDENVPRSVDQNKMSNLKPCVVSEELHVDSAQFTV